MRTSPAALGVAGTEAISHCRVLLSLAAAATMCTVDWSSRSPNESKPSLISDQAWDLKRV
eukprot:1150852-Pelagomonas_calceolata.AAC.1